MSFVQVFVDIDLYKDQRRQTIHCAERFSISGFSGISQITEMKTRHPIAWWVLDILVNRNACSASDI